MARPDAQNLVLLENMLRFSQLQEFRTICNLGDADHGSAFSRQDH
jgi:hypothetical protein